MKLFTTLLIIMIICTLAYGKENVDKSELIEKNEKIQYEPSTQDKVFVREYIYNASEDDSQNSSRDKALKQIKILLSEEVGTYIESYLDVTNENIGSVSNQSIRKEIQTLSVGISKVDIIDEDWNGKTYYVKAKVMLNEKKTMELLLNKIKEKSAKEDVERLNKILAEQQKVIDEQNSKAIEINKKLIKQEIANESRKNEIIDMKKQLVKYNDLEIKQKEEEKKYKTELEIKKHKIAMLNKRRNSETENEIDDWLQLKKLTCMFSPGVKKSDIEDVIGNIMTTVCIYCKSGNPQIERLQKVCPSDYLQKKGYGCIQLSLELSGGEYTLVNTTGCD